MTQKETRFTCACCGDQYGAGENMLVSQYVSDNEREVIDKRFGSLVCMYCAEGMRFCADTGAALKDGEGAIHPETGELYASEEVLAEHMAEQAENEQHIAAERHALGFFGGHF